MCQLLESIRILNGEPQNLPKHEARITRSQETLHGQRSLPLIIDIISQNKAPESGLYKARLVYEEGRYSIEYLKYEKRNILELIIIRTDSLDYGHKYADRSIFNDIKKDLDTNSEALIIIGDQIKETTYTNIAFRKNQQWFTPKNPILRGTMRAKLIEDNIITPLDIRTEDLKNYTMARLFNAMIPWSEAIEIPIDKIRDEKN